MVDEKEIGEKSYYVVQAVPDTKAKTLYIVTAFIGQKGYKKEAPQLINAKSLDATAKTDSANASKDIVCNDTEKVNSESVESMDITMDNETESIAPTVLLSDRDAEKIDLDYMDAVNRGDMKTAQKMVDEAAKQWGAFLNNADANEMFKQDGAVRVFYHGTNTGDFTVFDKNLLGSSSVDLGWFDKGFYFACNVCLNRFFSL